MQKGKGSADVLRLLRGLASQNGPSNRIYGSLRLVDTIEGSLGGGSNSSVISTSGFIDDGLKCTL